MTAEQNVRDVLDVQVDDRGRVTLGSEYANETLRVTIRNAIDIADLPVGFARHNLGLTEDGKRQMFADRRIGIDWSVGPSVAETTYRNHDNGLAIRDFNALREFAGGALVAAYYAEPFPDRMLLGVVEPGSEIAPVRYPGADGEPTYVKTLSLSAVEEVTAADAPALLDRESHPPYVSVCEWHEHAATVRETYLDRRR
jgi:hypothetical protein